MQKKVRFTHLFSSDGLFPFWWLLFTKIMSNTATSKAPNVWCGNTFYNLYHYISCAVKSWAILLPDCREHSKQTVIVLRFSTQATRTALLSPLNSLSPRLSDHLIGL